MRIRSMLPRLYLRSCGRFEVLLPKLLFDPGEDLLERCYVLAGIYAILNSLANIFQLLHKLCLVLRVKTLPNSYVALACSDRWSVLKPR